jgi:hypothetical protein
MGTNAKIKQNQCEVNSPADLLASLALALGGQVSGSSISAPGPGHSADDRSLSVTPCATAPSGFLVHSFAGDDPIACRDYVRATLDGSIDPSELRGVTVPRADNSRKAKWLWSIREPIFEDNPTGLYLRKRGYVDRIPAPGKPPPSLGYLPPNGKHPPAMIAGFGFCEEYEPGLIGPPTPPIRGVHLTRLTMEGDKAPIDPVKIMIGPSAGLPIVLAPANDLLAIDIAEDIEKGMAIAAATGAGMWVAGSAGRMPSIAAVLPSYVECTTIWADRDEAGLRFAQDAARIIKARGIDVRIKELPQ